MSEKIVVNSFPSPYMQLYDATGTPVEVEVVEEENKSGGHSSGHHKSDRRRHKSK